jgi:hypothetical protein
MQPGIELDHIIMPLQNVDRLEGESHHMWDDSFSNLAFGKLTPEMRERYIQQTYRATEAPLARTIIAICSAWPRRCASGLLRRMHVTMGRSPLSR